MIVVRVELWSAIDGHITELARMMLDNINTSRDMKTGDYAVRTYRGRSAEALRKAMINNTVQREGKVLGHKRLAEHVWNLVTKGLVTMGYGSKVNPEPADTEIGITKNYPAEYSLDQVLRAHRQFAAGSMTSVSRFEVDDLNIDNGFIAVRAIGPVNPDDVEALDEIFAKVKP